MGDRAATMTQILMNTSPPPPPPDQDDEDTAELDAAAGAQPSPIEKVKEGIDKDDDEDDEKEEEELDAADVLRQANEQLKQTAGRIATVGRDLWSSIGRVPAPGDIFLPISILALFFLIILPVNGHTRASWLFLALTGNAHIA